MKEDELRRPGLPMAGAGQLALYNFSSEYPRAGFGRPGLPRAGPAIWLAWPPWGRAGLDSLWQGGVGQLALYNLSSGYFPDGPGPASPS